MLPPTTSASPKCAQEVRPTRFELRLNAASMKILARLDHQPGVYTRGSLPVMLRLYCVDASRGAKGTGGLFQTGIA